MLINVPKRTTYVVFVNKVYSYQSCLKIPTYYMNSMLFNIINMNTTPFDISTLNLDPPHQMLSVKTMMLDTQTDLIC